MQTFKNQAKIMLPFLVTLLLIKVSNCAKYMLHMKMGASALGINHKSIISEVLALESKM